MELLPNKAYHITVEGSVSETSPINGKTFQLKEAQKMVEGYIEVVYLNDKQIIFPLSFRDASIKSRFQGNFGCIIPKLK